MDTVNIKQQQIRNKVEEGTVQKNARGLVDHTRVVYIWVSLLIILPFDWSVLFLVLHKVWVDLDLKLNRLR